ncbi:MAG: T9SS type A sorting domain-containing protein, partial [Ignavibacteriae bacterium]|nr:T9SS type A sorting domain-containing protein [Ignavibacteriota bacterium]
QNYPNPFNPTTNISYTIPEPTPALPFANGGSFQSVQLSVYDILGREVETLVNEEQKPGFYKVEWNANNYASGMYIYQLSINGNTSKRKVVRKKMLLLR